MFSDTFKRVLRGVFMFQFFLNFISKNDQKVPLLDALVYIIVESELPGSTPAQAPCGIAAYF